MKVPFTFGETAKIAYWNEREVGPQKLCYIKTQNVNSVTKHPSWRDEGTYSKATDRLQVSRQGDMEVLKAAVHALGLVSTRGKGTIAMGMLPRGKSFQAVISAMTEQQVRSALLECHQVVHDLFALDFVAQETHMTAQERECEEGRLVARLKELLQIQTPCIVCGDDSPDPMGIISTSR